ncbi:MAG: ACP S-malonyltransferase [Solirubrobacteraceae bacterium]
MIAALFPGQGSQTTEMRSMVEQVRPDLLHLCQRVLGTDPFERLDEGTHMTQPAIYCANLAGWSLVSDSAISFMAGHSLGELAALVAAGAISERDGLWLVALRGRLMQDAGGGGMIAVGAQLDEAAKLAERFGLVLANDNAPEQVVLSGDVNAIDAACESAKAEGIRAKRLPVSGAFHSPAMAAAAEELAEACAGVHIAVPRLPVLSCVTAAQFDDIPRRLVESLTSPVRWREIVLSLYRMGATRFLEVGPGHVLTGLVRKTIPGADAQVVQLEPAHA